MKLNKVFAAITAAGSLLVALLAILVYVLFQLNSLQREMEHKAESPAVSQPMQQAQLPAVASPTVLPSPTATLPTPTPTRVVPPTIVPSPTASPTLTATNVTTLTAPAARPATDKWGLIHGRMTASALTEWKIVYGPEETPLWFDRVMPGTYKVFLPRETMLFCGWLLNTEIGEYEPILAPGEITSFNLVTNDGDEDYIAAANYGKSLMVDKLPVGWVAFSPCPDRGDEMGVGILISGQRTGAAAGVSDEPRVGYWVELPAGKAAVLN